MRKRTVLFTLVVGALIFAGIWAMRKSAPSIESATIKMSLDNIVESLDPSRSYSDDSLTVSAQVLEPLYQYHYLKRPYEVEPLLAEGMPVVTEKGTVLTIKLKSDVKYHPHQAFAGKPRELKAVDFVNQFKRLTLESLKSPGKSLFTGLVKGFDEYGALIGQDYQKIPSTDIEGFRAIDERTLQIELTRSEPNFIYYLALNFVVPLPWEVIDHHKNNLDQVLVGTGPYTFNGFNGDYYEMQRFNEYRKDFYPTAGDRYANVQKLLDSSKEKIPFIENVQFHVTKETERWDKFLNKEIDLMSVPKPFIPRLYGKEGKLSEELSSRNIELKHFPILASRWFAFNMRDPLLSKNLNLRKAIAFAIDYNEYLQVISQNTNLRSNSILVPGIAGYRPAQDFRLKHDMEQARQYFAKAGFDPVKKRPSIVYSTRGTEGINILEGDFVKRQLEALGIDVTIQTLPFTDFLRKGRAGELQFFTDVWLFDYPDGENILQLLVSGNFPGINKSAYANPEVDRLYRRLKETTNLEMREQILHEAEDIVFEDLPWIPMMYESTFVLQYSKIKNFRKSSIIRNYMKYLKIED